MNKDKIDFEDALSDFSSAIQEHGAELVGKNFVQYFPTQATELFQVLVKESSYRQIPALFKPFGN